jgi:putative two-component system response regulator
MHHKILIVDDDAEFRSLLRAVLRPLFSVREAMNGEEALGVAVLWRPDLVLLDITMGGLDGYETCRRLKGAQGGAAPQVTIVSGKSNADELRIAFEAGADDYIIKPVNPFDLVARVRLHLRLKSALALAGAESQPAKSPSVVLPPESRGGFMGLDVSDEQQQVLLDTQNVAVFALSKLAETRDNETGAHLLRMREYSLFLARRLARDSAYAAEIDGQFLADLYRSAPLHDIGKVGIPDSILLKPGPLTPAEFETMKRHTTIGANILDQALTQTRAARFLTMAASIARFHHERWNGSGYPLKLAGKTIPLAARIVAVADVYDALTSERPYKRAWPRERAEQFILEQSGSHFDPVIVASFARCMEDFARIGREIGHDELPADETPDIHLAELAPTG